MGAREEHGPKWAGNWGLVFEEGGFLKYMIPGLRLCKCKGLLVKEVTGLAFLFYQGSTPRLEGCRLREWVEKVDMGKGIVRGDGILSPFHIKAT